MCPSHYTVPYDQVRTVRSHCDRTVVWSPIDFIRTRSIYGLIGLSAQTAPTRRWFMANNLRLNTIEAQVRKLEDKPDVNLGFDLHLLKRGWWGSAPEMRRGDHTPPIRVVVVRPSSVQPPLITQESNLLIGGVLQTEQLVTEH